MVMRDLSRRMIANFLARTLRFLPLIELVCEPEISAGLFGVDIVNPPCSMMKEFSIVFCCVIQNGALYGVFERM